MKLFETPETGETVRVTFPDGRETEGEVVDHVDCRQSEDIYMFRMESELGEFDRLNVWCVRFEGGKVQYQLGPEQGHTELLGVETL